MGNSIKWICIPSSLELQSPCLPSHHRQINRHKLFKVPAWVQPHQRTPHPIRIWKQWVSTHPLWSNNSRNARQIKKISAVTSLKSKKCPSFSDDFGRVIWSPSSQKNSRIQTQTQQKACIPTLHSGVTLWQFAGTSTLFSCGQTPFLGPPLGEFQTLQLRLFWTGKEKYVQGFPRCFDRMIIGTCSNHTQTKLCPFKYCCREAFTYLDYLKKLATFLWLTGLPLSHTQVDVLSCWENNLLDNVGYRWCLTHKNYGILVPLNMGKLLWCLHKTLQILLKYWRPFWGRKNTSSRSKSTIRWRSTQFCSTKIFTFKWSKICGYHTYCGGFKDSGVL